MQTARTVFCMRYSEIHILKRLNICDSLDYDGLPVNQGDSSTPARHSGPMTECTAKWCQLCADMLITLSLSHISVINTKSSDFSVMQL